MANGKRAYWLTDTISVSANATLEAELRVGANERFTGRKLLIQRTAGFEIRSITDDSGLPFTNADSGDPLTGDSFPDALTEHAGYLELPAPIIVEKSNAIKFSVTDTSGATNTIRVIILGEMEQLEKT